MFRPTPSESALRFTPVPRATGGVRLRSLLRDLRADAPHNLIARSVRRLPASAEPTIDQLSAMSANLELGSCWADFAMFGSYGDRTKKDRELFGLTVGTKSTSLDMYISRVRDFATRYGPSCWAMLHQADHRGRVEQIPRTKRQGAIGHAKALLVSQTAADNCWHDAAQPWPSCFLTLADDTKFWMREFMEPPVPIASSDGA